MLTDSMTGATGTTVQMKILVLQPVTKVKKCGDDRS